MRLIHPLRPPYVVVLDDIPALEPSLAHKSSLLAKLRRQQVARNLPDYIFSGLASIGCSDSEIATLTRCPKEDLKDKSQPIQEGKARLKHAIRKAQIKYALKGNPSLLIWLGKTYLGQSENPQQSTQHTNIVVTSDVLQSLQRSYSQSLADFRNSKARELNPVNPHDHFPSPQPLNRPDLPQLTYVPRGTVDAVSESSSTPLQSVDQQCNDEPACQVLGECEVPSSELEPTPPGGATPHITPTPTPKSPTSLGLGKSGKSGKLTRWSQYAVGVTAERWSGKLKKLKGARGGSRKEEVG